MHRWNVLVSVMSAAVPGAAAHPAQGATPPLRAPGVPNDTCADAAVLVCGQAVTAPVPRALDELAEPVFSCLVPHSASTNNGYGFGSVWYKFVATSPGAVVTTCPSHAPGGVTAPDSIMAAYSGDCPGATGGAGLTEIACNDDYTGCGWRSRLGLGGLTVGRTYYVKVANRDLYSTPAEYQLELQCSVPVRADACPSAQPLACGEWRHLEFTGATLDTDGVTDPVLPCLTPAPGGGGAAARSVWCTFIAQGEYAAVSARIDGLAAPSTLSWADLAMALYSGPCGPGATPLACSDDGPGGTLLPEVRSSSLTPGVAYLVQIVEKRQAPTQPRAYQIQLRCTPPPPPPINDACAGAAELACGLAVAADTSRATAEASDPAFPCRVPGPGPGYGSLWYTFVAPTASATLTTCASAEGDTLLAVYAGACGALTPVACNDDDPACTAYQSTVRLSGLTPGARYTVQLARYDAAPAASAQEFQLRLVCGDPCPADRNMDGEVNGNDVSEYINAWYGDIVAGTALADFNGDGETNGNDISDYINAWYAAIVNGGFC